MKGRTFAVSDPSARDANTIWRFVDALCTALLKFSSTERFRSNELLTSAGADRICTFRELRVFSTTFSSARRSFFDFANV
jgi:hypothetical protein